MPFKYHLPEYFKLLINYRRLIFKCGPAFAFNYILLFTDFKALVLQQKCYESEKCFFPPLEILRNELMRKRYCVEFVLVGLELRDAQGSQNGGAWGRDGDGNRDST